MKFDENAKDRDADIREAGWAAESEDPDAVEVVAEADEESGGEPEPGDLRVAQLSDALRQLNDKHLRLMADFDTFRRRTNKEKEEIGARAQASFAASLLESLDDLARVASSRAEGMSAAAYVEGVDLLVRKMMKSLAAAGLEVIDPAGAPFDPSLHEAVSAQPAASPEEDDTVGAVFQPGYLFKGQLLRPARVTVRKWSG